MTLTTNLPFLSSNSVAWLFPLSATNAVMLCPAPPKAHHPHSAVLFPSSDNSPPASVFLSSPPEISLLKLHYLFLPKSNHNLGSFLIFLDTLLNLSYPSRNSLPEQRQYLLPPLLLLLGSFLFLSSPMSPSFPPASWVVVSLALTRFWTRSGFAEERWCDSGRSLAEPRALDTGGLSSLGRGGALNRSGSLILGSPRPGQCGRRFPGWGLRTRLTVLAGDGVQQWGCEATAWQGAASPPGRVWGAGAWGRFHPWPGHLLGAFPRLVEGLGAGGGLAWSRLRGVAAGRARTSPSRGRGSGFACKSDIPQPPPAVRPSHATSFSWSQLPALASPFNHAFLSAEMACPHPTPFF